MITGGTSDAHPADQEVQQMVDQVNNSKKLILFVPFKELK